MAPVEKMRFLMVRQRFYLLLSLAFLCLCASQANAAGPTPLPLALGPRGAAPDGWADAPAISADGRVVAFVSTATNLVANDSNTRADIFLFDTGSRQTNRIPVASGGAQPDGWSYQPALSADGRFVAFTSFAANLSSEDHNQTADVIVYDRERHQTQFVSVASSGAQAEGWSGEPGISGDGRWVVFSSLAGNLDPACAAQSLANVFLHDRQSGETRCISLPPPGEAAFTWASFPALSADGRFAAFLALWVGGQAGGNSGTALYLYDRLTSQTTRLAPTANRALAPLPLAPAISANGGRIVFAAPDPQGGAQLWMVDRAAGKTIALPGASTTRHASLAFSLSADGGFLGYYYWGKSMTGKTGLLDIEAGSFTRLSTQDWTANDPPYTFRPALTGAGQGAVWVAPGESQAGWPQIYLSPPAEEAGHANLLSGWISDGLGHPLAGITLVEKPSGRSFTTGQDGSYQFTGLDAGQHTLKPVQEGYAFSPEILRIQTRLDLLGNLGLVFTAFPEGVVREARGDLGMPYGGLRGCASPFAGCGGPYHGFFRGDCTDLVIDAYKAGIGVDLEGAISADYLAHPTHDYVARSARSSEDLWRYFTYTGQRLEHRQPYLPGDIIFFDWENDGAVDHVAIVSEVNPQGRPTRLLDATGVVDYNPSGLAADLAWQALHEAHVVGHARWFGLVP